MATDVTSNNDVHVQESPGEIEPKPHYMKKFVQACQFIKMWPKEVKTLRYHFIVWGITIFCLLFITTFYIRIQMEGKNMDGIAETIDFATVFTSGTFRFFYVHARGEKYLLLVSLIKNNFIHCTFFPERNKASLKKYTKSAYRVIVFYGCFTFFWILQFCTVPGLSYLWAIAHTRPLIEENGTEVAPDIPYPVAMKVYIPFDVTSQPINALLFYVYQIIGFCFFGSVYVITDCFWYMVIFLTIGQLALIRESLDTVTEVLNENEDEENEVKLLEESRMQEIQEGLKKCIRQHQFTKEFILMIDNIFNPIVLVDLLHATISLAFILLDATIAINKEDWFKLMYSLEYFVTSITHMFFFDWLGNELAFEQSRDHPTQVLATASESHSRNASRLTALASCFPLWFHPNSDSCHPAPIHVFMRMVINFIFGITISTLYVLAVLSKEEELAEAIHRMSWFRCPRVKVNIMMVSALSRRPYRLTGGKMYRLNLHFFTTMIKAIFSYFTFLFQLRNAKTNVVDIKH